MKYRKSVFVVVYSKTKKGVEYLILKRKLHWRGWEFPKGGIKKFESKKKSVRREIKEETGLSPFKISRFSFSGKFDYDRKLKDRPGFVGQDFSLYSVEVKKGKVKVDGKEHDDYKWVTFKEAMKKLKWINQRKSLKVVNNSL